MKVLWIAGWYPNPVEPYTGDFVKRHAEAISSYCTVTVLYVGRDVRLKQSECKVNRVEKGSLTEIVITYNSCKWLGKIGSQIKYEQIYKKHIEQYIREKGKPAVIHFYIGMRIAVLAKWVKQKLGIPYVISEQWTGFLDEGVPHFNSLNSYFKNHWKKAIKNAAGIQVVSSYLGKAIARLSGRKEGIIVIPNVVNTDIFRMTNVFKNESSRRFVHVTGAMDYQKNTRDIILAFSQLKEEKCSVILDIIGNVTTSNTQLVDELGLKDIVRFTGELNQEEIMGVFSNSIALIIYSRFETFGCVIIEALAAGIPVVASNLQVFYEIINDKENGFLVVGENKNELANAIKKVLKKDVLLESPNKISSDASVKYAYESVGKQFRSWYEQIIRK